MARDGDTAREGAIPRHREGDGRATAYLDTSVFVYAAGAPHAYRGPCRRLLDAARAGRLAATTSVEVIQEIVHLYLGRAERKRAVDVAEAAIVLVGRILPVEENDVRSSLTLIRSVADLSSRDAIHAALCLRHDLPVVSADRDFDRVPGLRRIDPADPSQWEDPEGTSEPQPGDQEST